MATAPFILSPFLDYLQFEKRYSQHTVRSYQDDLTQFFDYLNSNFGQTAVGEINSSMVRTWMASLKDGKLTSKTINRKASSLKSFFKYQLKLGNIESTPMTNVSAPKIGKRLPSFVMEEDMNVLLKEIAFPDDWDGRTTQLLIAVFYATGIRLSELVNLKEQSVNRSSTSIKVLGKGNKERIIPVNKQLIESLVEYQKEKRRLFEDFDSDYLFVTPKGKKLYAKYVYLRVKSYLSQVTTLQKKSPHILRHTFATHLTNHGADLNAIKELLGHSSLASTQVYTHNSIEKLKEAYKKAHPKA